MEKKTEFEQRKVSEGVFDKATLSTLYTLMRKGLLDEVKGIISTGKEANVYCGLLHGKDVAVKIYAVEAADFKAMEKYLLGDRRFSSWKNRRQLIYMWAKKEFKNLSRVCDSIRCPRPVGVENNVLVMEFIGDGGIPAPRLKDHAAEDPEEFYFKIRDYMRKINDAGLVHGDLSEYNILNSGEPVVIDFSMGVLLDHPHAAEFLERDAHNIASYFRKQGVSADEKELLRYVRSE